LLHYSPKYLEGVFSEVRLLVSILAALVEGGLSLQPENPAQRKAGAKPMAQGTVKWFNQDKDCGFTTPDEEGEEIFVHYTGIAGSGFKNLEEGDRVSYEPTRGRKGEQAENVRKV
jgi:cold shock protein